MGRFGIGARVRDDGGDEGVIVDKAKGQRFVQYDDTDYGKLWQAKGYLTALPTNDNAGAPSISAEISESAYVAVGDNSDKPWVPKVGDRVRFVRDSTAGGWCFGKAGEEAEVTEPVRGSGETLAVSVRLSTTKCDFDPGAYIRDLEPVVAPATTWTPTVGERVVVLTDKWLALHKNGIGTVKSDPGHGVTVVVDGDDGFGWFFDYSEVAQATSATTALKIEAGKFYRTRDGRKVGPMEFHGGAWPWSGLSDGGRPTFLAGGRWWSDDEENNTDLVAEWVEPALTAWQAATEEPEVAVAEATATPWTPAVGEKVRCIDECGGSKFRTGDIYTVREVCDGLVYVEEIERQAMFTRRFEPAAPPAKFKVGDRVVVNTDRWYPYHKGSLATVTAVLDVHAPVAFQAAVDAGGDSFGWYFDADELELAPAIPIGSTVTFTATGRLSAYTADGHAQIVFPGLTPGQNSFALPAAFVALAN